MQTDTAILWAVLLGLTNSALAFLAQLLVRRGRFGVPGQEMLFFLLLFTLIVTLYDRWRPIYDLRLQSERR